LDIAGLNETLEKKNIERRPQELLACISPTLEKNVNFKLRETVMRKSEIGFVVIQRFPINFIRFVCPPMAVWTQRNQIFILMLLASFPWDDVVDIHFNVTARRNSASMSGFNQNPTAKFCWYWGAITHLGSMRHNVRANPASGGRQRKLRG
jgi:hypothetical protein